MSENSRLFWPPKDKERGTGKPHRRPPQDGRSGSGLRGCDHDGCAEIGDYRAPKSRDTLNDYYWFCLDHVRAYNASWNFYAGMNADEIESLLRNDVTWERPTWPMGQRTGGFRIDASKIKDGFGIFGEEFSETLHERGPVNAPEMAAMREMNLKAPLSVELVRARYKELCKLHHPDANGGDKEAEERFKRIGQAYKTLMESLL
jgi:hypothetical protein